MAMDQSALLDLLAALKDTDVSDRIRTATEHLYQELIDAEATAVIGAGPWQRTTERTALRNGSRDRVLTTTAGDLELRIPKLRTGSFFPSLLERRRRVDQALFAVVMEAYLHGVSTRKVDDLVKALGADSGISKSEVSRICAGLDQEVAAFRDRSLAETSFPYVYLDATYCKARVGRRRSGACSAAERCPRSPANIGTQERSGTAPALGFSRECRSQLGDLAGRRPQPGGGHRARPRRLTVPPPANQPLRDRALWLVWSMPRARLDGAGRRRRQLPARHR